MRHSLMLILLLFCCLYSIGNQGWQYKSTRDGITLIAVGGYEDSIGNQRMYDGFLDILVAKSKKYRNGIKVLLLLDQSMIRSRSDKWFATIAYDKLREEDWEFIEAYTYYRRGEPESSYIASRKLPSEKYKIDLSEPIDINSAFTEDEPDLGLKIIYDYGVNDSITVFDRIFTLMRYGLENINEIKRNQRSIIMDCNYGIQVSVLTIDTSKIQSLPLIATGYSRTAIETYSKRNIIIGTGFIALLIAILILSLYKRVS